MKAILLLSLFLPLAALATERLPQAGTYEYEGRFEVLQKRKAEAVYAFTEKGRQRLEELRSQGQACEHIANRIFRCVEFQNPQGTEGEIASRAGKILNGSALEFGRRTADPETLHKGDSYVEWLVPQPISFLGKSYPHFRYSLLEGRLHKFSFGEPTEDGVMAEADGSFTYVTTIRVQLSRELILSYFIRARYR